MVSPLKILAKHPIITEADSLQALCHPLERFGIGYFCHVRMHADGRMNAMCNNPAWTEHYVRHDYQNIDLHVNQQAKVANFILWDMLEKKGGNLTLSEDSHHFGLNNTFSIVKPFSGYTDFYHFALKAADSNAYQKYLSSVVELEMFILHYVDKVKSSKSLQKAYEISLKVQDEQSSVNGIHPPAFDSAGVNARKLKYYGHDIHNALSSRELTIVKWLLYGKTANEISIILGLAHSTVNNHITNIKRKLGCYSMFQLGSKIQELYQDTLPLLIADD